MAAPNFPDQPANPRDEEAYLALRRKVIQQEALTLLPPTTASGMLTQHWVHNKSNPSNNFKFSPSDILQIPRSLREYAKAVVACKANIQNDLRRLNPPSGPSPTNFEYIKMRIQKNAAQMNATIDAITLLFTDPQLSKQTYNMLGTPEHPEVAYAFDIYLSTFSRKESAPILNLWYNGLNSNPIWQTAFSQSQGLLLRYLDSLNPKQSENWLQEWLKSTQPQLIAASIANGPELAKLCPSLFSAESMQYWQAGLPQNTNALWHCLNALDDAPRKQWLIDWVKRTPNDIVVATLKADSLLIEEYATHCTNEDFKSLINLDGIFEAMLNIDGRDTFEPIVALESSNPITSDVKPEPELETTKKLRSLIKIENLKKEVRNATEQALRSGHINESAARFVSENKPSTYFKSKHDQLSNDWKQRLLRFIFKYTLLRQTLGRLCKSKPEDLPTLEQLAAVKPVEPEQYASELVRQPNIPSTPKRRVTERARTIAPSTPQARTKPEFVIKEAPAHEETELDSIDGDTTLDTVDGQQPKEQPEKKSPRRRLFSPDADDQTELEPVGDSDPTVLPPHPTTGSTELDDVDQLVTELDSVDAQYTQLSDVCDPSTSLESVNAKGDAKRSTETLPKPRLHDLYYLDSEAEESPVKALDTPGVYGVLDGNELSSANKAEIDRATRDWQQRNRSALFSATTPTRSTLKPPGAITPEESACSTEFSSV